DELIPSSNIHPGMDALPRSVFLPLARACHCTLALRYCPVDDPLAAWLYPVFLLRFVRTQPLWRGILLALLATVLVLEVAWQGFLPFPWVLSVPLVFVVGVIITLPYLIDRVVAPRLGGMLGTLVFPLAVTTVWYLFAVVSPWGQYISIKAQRDRLGQLFGAKRSNQHHHKILKALSWLKRFRRRGLTL